MSTLATADLTSDDEEDEEYIPDQPKSKAKSSKARGKSISKHPQGPDSEVGSSSSCISSDDDDEGNDHDKEEVKRLKADQEAVLAEGRRKKAAEAYRAMRDEVMASSSDRPLDASSSGTVTSVGGTEGRKMVKTVQVKRARRFAGETI